jgi:EAL domain-containing protein (putative c-di-GMP-specific phosphodiesterase class I)
MQTRYWPLLAGLALCLTAAFGCVAYVFSGGESPLLAFALCALALMVGMAMLGAYASFQASLAENNDRQLFRRFATFSSNQDTAQKQADHVLAELSSLKESDRARSAAMAQTLGELKTSYQALAQSMTMQSASDNFNDEDVADTEMNFAPAPVAVQAPAIPIPRNIAEELALSLEPIVDLISGQTAHYRVHLGPEQLIEQATYAGQRQDVDTVAVYESLNLLRRLHQRDPNVNIFIPIAAETLSSPQHVLNLLETLQAWPNEAQSLVFELPHVVLAGLSSSALDGLGSFARSHQPLSLANVSVAGLDPTTLRGLNVHHVSIDATAIDLRFGMPSTYTHFAQLARIAEVQILLANISDVSGLHLLRKLSRLGSGPAFAPPRRVRREVAAQAIGLAA